MNDTRSPAIDRYPTALAKQQPLILLVDDDDRNLVALSECLSGLDADVVCASSGKEALRLVLAHDFAVILLDIRLPDLDGYETAALIRQRERSRRIPIIFLTAVHKDEAHIFRGYSAGAVDYVFKPVEPLVLRAKVATFIELRMQADEIRRQAEYERRLLEDNYRIRAEKWEAMNQLRSSEARQAHIIRSLPIALYEADSDDPRARSFVDDNVNRLLGFPRSRFEQDPTLWAVRVHPEDWQCVIDAIESLPTSGDYSVQYRWKCADGSYRYVLDQGVITGGTGERAPKIFGTMFDVHDQRMLEQQLAHAQKIDAIGKLTGGIAHDFNNMLAIIIGNLDRIARSEKLDKSLASYFDLAMQGAMHCRDTTKRLVAFARQQSLSPRPLIVNDIISGLADLLDRTLGERVEIKHELAEDLWPVYADPVQFEASIVNLLVNARDAMPRGGTVILRTENIEFPSPPAAESHLPAGRYVMLEVTDTGTGMEKEVLSRALEPFFTTKDVGRGTGLGLSSIHGFVKQSGGDIAIESEVGKGTSVRIYLPRHDKLPRRVSSVGAGDDHSKLPRAVKNARVLVVEDDADVRRTAAGMLRDFGYDVAEAENAAIALDMLEQTVPELLFTDYLLPGPMNGRQLAKEAMRRHPELKVLYTTAFAGDSMRKFSDNELDPLLRKPYRDIELAHAVCDALLQDSAPESVASEETFRSKRAS